MYWDEIKQLLKFWLFLFVSNTDFSQFSILFCTLNNFWLVIAVIVDIFKLACGGIAYDGLYWLFSEVQYASGLYYIFVATDKYELTFDLSIRNSTAES